MHDPRANSQNTGFSAGRRAFREQINRCGRADVLGHSGHSRKRGAGEQQGQAPGDTRIHPRRHKKPSETDRWAHCDGEILDRIPRDIRI